MAQCPAQTAELLAQFVSSAVTLAIPSSALKKELVKQIMPGLDLS